MSTTDPQDGAFVPPRATETPLRGIPASPPDTPNAFLDTLRVVVEALEDVWDTWCESIEWLIYGDEPEPEPDIERLIHLAHGMVCARSGAATELDYYGSDT